MRCPACGNMIFPKIAPAVIIGLTDGDRLLISQYANRNYKRYALLAGFIEIGETAEEAEKLANEKLDALEFFEKIVAAANASPQGEEHPLL